MKSGTFASIAGATLAAVSLLALPAIAQNDKPNEKKNETNSGPLQPPKPYGDRGTTTLGNPPIHYPTRPNSNKNPLDYWKSRIITGPGYYGNTIIIVGDSPCFVPFYYRYGLQGFYDNGFFVVGGAFGGQQYGYGPGQQNYGNGGAYQDYGYRQEPTYQRASNPPQSRSANPDDSEYYLHKKAKPKTALEKDPLLAEAVADIEAAFRTANAARLEKHIVATDMLTLQAKGRTRKPLAAAVYLQMTKEAFTDMKTLKYDLSSVEPASNGAWLVYGTHVLRTEEGAQKTFNVAFVLKKRGEAYVITEVSADPV